MLSVKRSPILKSLMLVATASSTLAARAYAQDDGGPSPDQTVRYINSNMVYSSTYPQTFVVSGDVLRIDTANQDPTNRNNYDNGNAVISTIYIKVEDLAVNKIGLKHRESGEADDVILACAPNEIDANKNCATMFSSGWTFGSARGGATTIQLPFMSIPCKPTASCYNAVIHLLRLLNTKEVAPADPFK
jgi:hypothetical protein